MIYSISSNEAERVSAQECYETEYWIEIAQKAKILSEEIAKSVYDGEIHRSNFRYAENRTINTVYSLDGQNICSNAVKTRFYNISATFPKQNSKIDIVKYGHNETKEQEYYGKQIFYLQLFGSKK